MALGDLYSLAADEPRAGRRQYDARRVPSPTCSARTASRRPRDRAIRGRPRRPAARSGRACRVGRRHSVHVADALAWALHVNGRDREARRMRAGRSRSTRGTRCSRFHPGMIELALGDDRGGPTHLAQALALEPALLVLHAPTARRGPRRARRHPMRRPRASRSRSCVVAAALGRAGRLRAPARQLHGEPLQRHRLHARPVRVDYVVDMAEIPTFQLLPEIDSDGDGSPPPPSSRPGSPDGARLGAGSSWVDGAPVALRRASAGRVARSGRPADAAHRGGLRRRRSAGPARSRSPTRRPRRDRLARDHRRRRRGRRLSPSTFPPRASATAAPYPQDLLQPARRHERRPSFAPGAAAPHPDRGGRVRRPGPPSGPVRGRSFRGTPREQGVADAAGPRDRGRFGAWHALLPGHGKTLMAAYMVGTRRTFRQAVGSAPPWPDAHAPRCWPSGRWC